MFFDQNRFFLSHILFLAFCCCQISILSVFAETGIINSQQTETVYGYLAAIHLPTLANEESKETEKNAQIEMYNQEIKDKWFNIGGTVKIPALGNVEKLRHAYLIFGEQDKEANNATVIPHLNKITIEDLELFSGQKTALQRHVLAIFEPYLHTAIGKVQLQKMLSQPLTNIEALKQRQNLIAQLLNDTTKLEQLNAKLQEVTIAENEFLWFWKNVSKTTFKQLEKDAVPMLFPLPDATMNYIEKNPGATEALTKGSLLLKLLCNPISWVIGGLGYAGYRFGTDLEFRNKLKQAWEVLKSPDTLNSLNENKGYIGMITAEFILLTSMISYQNAKDIAGYNAATNAIHAKINEVTKIIRIANELLGPDVLDYKTKDIASFVNLLNTETFKSDPSFFSYKGRAISAFTLMSELKQQFVSTLEKLGQLDAYVAIASFMRANQNNENGKYCFPIYVQKDLPYLNLNQYWHPFLNPKTVVINNIELGGNVAQNIVVTGPNAGGKSTALKSITLSIILAQTLGIAPAQSMTFTPFKNINTYMNIADDAGSESLFQAEMHRAATLVKMAQNQSSEDFAFIAMDELFTGTNPIEGKSAAYGVIKKLISYNNCMLLFSTHFKELTELEEEMQGKIKNFKVHVNKTESTESTACKISYEYKLIPGISDQTIALDLLAQDGFDQDILDYSYAKLDSFKKNN
ncbi:MAG: hypothetical protein V1646_02005 [bacterium]